MITAGMADLERGLARLQGISCGASSGRDAANVVLYEDQGKRRVASMVTVLKGLRVSQATKHVCLLPLGLNCQVLIIQALQDAIECFDGVRPDLQSALLRRLVTPGEIFPDMADELRALEESTDWDSAMTSGKVLPSKSVSIKHPLIEHETQPAGDCHCVGLPFPREGRERGIRRGKVAC